MRDTHMLSGLKQLRGEYLGKITPLHKQVAELEADIETETKALADVDAVIQRLDPECKLESIKARLPQGSRTSTRGDGRRVPITWAVMQLLRIRNVPMTVNEIVDSMRVDYPQTDPKKLTANVRIQLSTKKAKGVLRTTPTAGRAHAYSFALGLPEGRLALRASGELERHLHQLEERQLAAVENRS